ncbi:hypothetical protein J8L98_15245 [Pseudoalteromonas sp. MMG013]|uniref:hypothetical protein n=1 Tax=Pseudoalteromonas sp. MMG013 TaxID=2822687 RepID=UPI001B3771FC|nr:hypothetical protein [Pseudoalteromonas sp. MMG013]MBQ4863040.1 hypothetical protein [Pseudoalteromonas sp. MMG013]
MYRNLLKITVVLFFLSGCAERVIDITDQEGKIVGACNAGFDWHFYGLQDSIDYMLYECAKESIAKGFNISDERLLTLDFTLPQPPEDELWNKKLAMHYFHQNLISERKLGYILAAIEYEYQKVAWPAEDDLADGKITQAEFNKIIKDAKFKWLGE